MSTNPFDPDDGVWQVVVDERRQYALWRPFLDLPAGWSVVVPGAGREEALDHVERHWAGLAPAVADARSGRGA
jgi:MbtH protein